MDTYNRRTFLKYTGAAVVGAGSSGCGTIKRHNVGNSDKIAVRIEATSEPLVFRTFSILKDRIRQRCPVRVVQADNHAQIILSVDDCLPHDAFCIDQADEAIRVTGGSPSGLLYGVGKFLRTCRYDGSLQFSSWRGTSVPRGSLRGIYFASHFHNWYQQASEPEICRYMEDLALWGINAVMVAFPGINLHGWDDPQTEPAVAMIRRYSKSARDLGLQFAIGANNMMFMDIPDHIRATRLPDPLGRRGNSGHPVCPSTPEGHAYLMANYRQLLEKLSDAGLDILCFWPYDEGGCACEKCQPWGSKGYLKLSRDHAQLGRNTSPT